MARTFGRCIGCGDMLTEPGFRTCSRCAVLLDGIDLTDIPASRGPCTYRPRLKVVSPAATM